ncbi:hypothetical protein [Pseudorhodoferax sp. Leaf267]|uniref:hypothetical protein n=1 Tax=Pseudorhodoferax sp. Leaf267 TaxID=1736316 RepID=UPI0006F94AF8|nr:hypothetical protein [Pseudorhodoferax sp. Leaf267]KQP12617.1 hypothetical protein ASF43_20460 [Pseudorhodoferax sp. Leaf267]
MQLLRGLGLFVAITCLVWVGVLWHWQATQRDMSPQDILLYLGALPVTVFVLGVASAWALRGVSTRTATASARSDLPSAATSTPTSAEAGHDRVQLLLAHAVSGAGGTVDDVLQAAQAGAPRPVLDTELHDAQGLPVLVARVGEVDAASLAQELESLQAGLVGPASVAASLDDATFRALALLTTQLEPTIDALAAWPERLGRPAETLRHTAAAVRTRVRVLVAWPAGTSEAQRALLQAWLDTWLRTHAEGVVAPDAWLLHATTAGSGPELWLEADRLLAAMAREEQDDLVLLAACHSDLDAASIERLEEAGALFCATQPKGCIPGEGAAVLVLAGAHWPPAKADAPFAPHLHRAAIGRRDKAVDAAGRVGSELAQELLRQSLAAAGVEAGTLAGLASDADQHSARGPEMYGAMLAQLPDLDVGEDLCMAGQLSGRTGPVATLLTVAMAAQRCAQTQRPWAALSVADPHWRLALLARPAPAPAPHPATAATDQAVHDDKTAA